MVSKRMRDWPFIAAPTWAFGVTAYYVIQDHPAYIPCGQRWPLRPELEALLGVCPLSQLTQGVGGSSCLLLSGRCCTLLLYRPASRLVAHPGEVVVRCLVRAALTTFLA